MPDESTPNEIANAIDHLAETIADAAQDFCEESKRNREAADDRSAAMLRFLGFYDTNPTGTLDKYVKRIVDALCSSTHLLEGEDVGKCAGELIAKAIKDSNKGGREKKVDDDCRD